MIFILIFKYIKIKLQFTTDVYMDVDNSTNSIISLMKLYSETGGKSTPQS